MNSEKAPSRSQVYFVMNKSDDHWIKVSETYTRRHDAEYALEQLRRTYPFARLGGANVLRQL